MDQNWESKVKGLLKAELKRREVTYQQLAEKLADIGIKVFKLTHWLGAPNPAGKPAIKGG